MSAPTLDDARAWLEQDPGESQVRPGGIEEAATAGNCSPSSGTGATAVVSAAIAIPARSSSPASDGLFETCAAICRAAISPPVAVPPAPATCCDTPTPVAVECPVCEGDPYRPVRVSVGDPPEDAECPRCEGQGTITECDACGAEVEA